MTERRMVQVYEGDGVKQWQGWAPTAACLCCYDLIEVGSTLCERCEFQYRDCSCDKGRITDSSGNDVRCPKCHGQAYVRRGN